VFNIILLIITWGLGIGDWGLGIGPNPQSPIPNPQSPIPKPDTSFEKKIEEEFGIVVEVVIPRVDLDV
jgi:hypothetical protein